MDNMSYAADLVRDREITYIDYVSEVSAAAFDTFDGVFRPWDMGYWKMVRNARENGKKVIFISGPAPVEIIYAMDCIPLYLDLLPSRLSENTVLTSRLIGETEKRLNPTLCRLNMAELGVLLSGNMGVSPDAYVAVPIPCDSARTTYSSIENLVEAPSFHFDIPLRHDERSLRYVEMQFTSFISFMEKVAGKELNWEKLEYHMELSDRAGRLLEKCAQLRRHKPCPMSSHMTVWNELMNAFSPTENMSNLINRELDICNARIASGEGPCPGGEKHRVLLLHNMLWQGIDLTDWLESEYNAVTVMDGYCFRKREYFENRGSKQDCIRIMCKKMLSGSIVHGAGASGEELLEMVGGIVEDYSVDVCIFMGNSGCRHEWASTKMLTDSLQEKFGMSMLIFDVDNTDRKYKTDREIKSAIAEYMETVIRKL